MSTPARRTRTGCKTCRQRKLKCDETKPICGQCRKSNRECQPSEGIAFRHAQNAGMEQEGGKSDLSSFYKYRQKFNNTFFLPVPKELSFVHITDPYADETAAQAAQRQHQHQQHHHQQQHQYQQPLPSPHHYNSLPEDIQPQYVDVAASSLKAMIDPALEQTTGTAAMDQADTEGVHLRLELEHAAGMEHADVHPLTQAGEAEMAEMTEHDQLQETIIKALRDTNEQVQGF